MENFKEKLNKLLEEFPDLPELHLHIRPRVTIELPKTSVPVVSPLVDNSPKQIPKEEVSTVLGLEAMITPAKIKELTQGVIIE